MKFIIGLFLLSTLCFAQPKVKVLFITTSLDFRANTKIDTINKEINKFITDNKVEVINVDLEKVGEDNYIVTIVYDEKM